MFARMYVHAHTSKYMIYLHIFIHCVAIAIARSEPLIDEKHAFPKQKFSALQMGCSKLFVHHSHSICGSYCFDCNLRCQSQ
jgi:hypothetical protein